MADMTKEELEEEVRALRYALARAQADLQELREKLADRQR